MLGYHLVLVTLYRGLQLLLTLLYHGIEIQS
jgi:hypothetical protein